MRVLVTGSSGHLGEALARTLREAGREVVGLDILEAPFTTGVGSVADRSCVRRYMTGVQAVFHTATLHKPHVATHSRQAFIDTNITGALWKRRSHPVLAHSFSPARPASSAMPSSRLLEPPRYG